MTARRDDILTLLERFGLSTYEAKAYLAAVGQPPLTGYKLAQLSGVPRPRIYEIVDRLAAKGFLIFQSGSRSLLTAANYEKILSQKEAENREIIDRLRKLLSAVPSAESSGIWNISGRDQVLITREYIRHEVFLNTLFGGEDRAATESYVRKYRNLMRRLP